MLNGLWVNDFLRGSRYDSLSLKQLNHPDARSFGVRIGNRGLLRLLDRGIALAEDSMEKRKAVLDGRNVLLAEDVDINAEIMKELLSVRNINIDHASDGEMVLEMFSESPVGHYDASLMDIRMPKMDGLEATAAIRKLERADAKRIPVIALTANAFDEDVQRSLQVGMNAHLSKPIEPERLYQTMEELIWEYRGDQ